ncbi:N-formylglutamate amidohydrolase [Tsuneonella suprasediminis]|uniref:N-formylglutamate amidohydrolase n=1 Tax=Tsuneonella suprasediminis TaxID=2306996 RepID=A0A419R0P9_9SPHN|nr:N-formylglutamate amidohydrolase [Tsuneonella suprasediminis]RJX67016.1 N-formylglutamate amidohydrolase [Tsuneonella suprasediminis]
MNEWQPFRQLGLGDEPRKGGVVCVADHASNYVPGDLPLGIAPELLSDHIAVDIGVEGTAERLALRHHIPAHLACISRLVIDLHREEDHPGVVPTTSDGHLIPGNIGADLALRIERFHRPYHAALADFITTTAPRLIISLHSFTPALASKPGEQRPWEVGLLYNTDDRAARHAIRLFAEQGLTVGDNEPYSGKQLNATMNRHAESAGIPYLAIEVRNDQIRTEAGQARWAAMIADIAGRVAVMVDAAG